MKLSLKVEYACRVMAQLGRHQGSDQWPHIEELARLEAVPANYLVQILHELRSAGLIRSRRGKSGGYSLAHPPADITLLEVVRAVDGEMLGFTGNPSGASGARVAGVWADLSRALEDRAGRVTLESFLRDDHPGMYHI